MFVQDAENNWHFDIFGFADATPNTSLSMMVFFLMTRLGALSKFGLREARLRNYLQTLEAGYKEQPYHNRCILRFCIAVL